MIREKPYGKRPMIASCIVLVLLMFLPTSVMAKDKTGPSFYQVLCDLYRATGIAPPISCDTYPQPPAKLVFVSSTSSNGNLGGLSGADSKCQALADAAGLSGEFKAWLSDSSFETKDRLTHSTGPYVKINPDFVETDPFPPRPDEFIYVAASWRDLTDGTLLSPIDSDERGVERHGHVWAATNPDGSGYNNHTCSDWTYGEPGWYGSAGDSSYSDGHWTLADYEVFDCPASAHLYCIEQ